MSSVWEFEYTPLSHTHQCIELFTHYYYSNASLFYCKSYYLVLASVMVSLSDRVLSAEFGIILIYWCVTKWRILKPSPSCHVNSNRFIDALCQWCILVCKCSLVSPSGMVFGISISICIRYWCHNYLEIGCRVYHSQFILMASCDCDVNSNCHTGHDSTTYQLHIFLVCRCSLVALLGMVLKSEGRISNTSTTSLPCSKVRQNYSCKPLTHAPVKWFEFTRH